MTKLLEQVVEVASALPEDKQNDFARHALENFEGDSKWDALFADPRSEVLLDQLVAEAMLDIKRGETEDFDAELDAHDEVTKN